MANRIVGSVYYIDSALNNVSLPWLAGARIQSISLWSADSTGTVIFTGANTTDVVARLSSPANGNTGQTNHIYLGGVRFDEMKVPTITAGTAWIYFS